MTNRIVQDKMDSAFGDRSLRITTRYNLKPNGGYDKAGLVIEVIRWIDGKDPRIRIQTAVNGASFDTVLYMKLPEFLDALGITKGDLNAESHKEEERV